MRTNDTPACENSKPTVWTFDRLKDVATNMNWAVAERSLSPFVRGITVGYIRLIVVNDVHPELIKRFALAHELGHIALKHKGQDDMMAVPGERDQLEEREAHRWAAALLLPASIIQAIEWERPDECGLVDDLDRALAERELLPEYIRPVALAERDMTFSPTPEEWLLSGQEWRA